MRAADGWRGMRTTCRRLCAITLRKLVAPYFRAIVDWYEAVGIGVTGGELHAIIERIWAIPFSASG